jgi:DNA invertase Pin-like site-specific DNA recombinase
MEAVAYVRVSSRAQDLASQRAAIERAALARGDTIAQWFSEKLSARTIARPELTRLRGDARAGKVRRLYVFRLDRLARSGVRDLLEVVEELRASGVELVTLNDGFGLDGPAAEVVLSVLAWSAKMERLAINERIAAARERVESEGRTWGRPPRMTPEELATLAQLRRRGYSLRQVARELRVPLSTVARAARRVPKTSAGIRRASPLKRGA